MKDVIIVGAGGFGREVFNYVEDCIKAGKNWRIKGFIDDRLNALDNYDYFPKVIAKNSEYIPENNDVFILAIGSPEVKKTVSDSLLKRGAVFENLIHPTAYVGRNVRLGKGIILCPNAILTCDLEMGDFVTVNCHTSCGHDSKIGNYTTFSSHCDVTGFCQVGEGAFFASHVSMRPSSKVGDWASVGIGSCVIMNIKPGVSAFGNPAVAIKK